MSIADQLQKSLAESMRLHEFLVKPPNVADLIVNPNLASEFHKRLVKWIKDFDASLDEAHEVGACLVSFGEKMVFHINRISYWNPSLICFAGVTEDGSPVELIQHVGQISILLTRLPRRDPSKPKRQIGFVQSENDGEST